MAERPLWRARHARYGRRTSQHGCETAKGNRMAGNPFDRLTDRARSPLTEAPPPAEVEIELQRIARRRLDHAADGEAGSHPHGSSRHRRQPIVGAFDSPDPFAFGSNGTRKT
jgi:hypothetical protein